MFFWSIFSHFGAVHSWSVRRRLKSRKIYHNSHLKSSKFDFV